MSASAKSRSRHFAPFAVIDTPSKPTQAGAEGVPCLAN